MFKQLLDDWPLANRSSTAAMAPVPNDTPTDAVPMPPWAVISGALAVDSIMYRRTGICAPGAGGNGNLADNFGENLAALGVLRPFVAADIGPFTVAGHEVINKSAFAFLVRTRTLI